MERFKRNSVFVATIGSIGLDLIFQHYTSKVVAAIHPRKGITKTNRRMEQRIKLKEANAYAQEVLKSAGLIAIYEKYLEQGESVYQKAMQDYFNQFTK